MRLFLDSSVLIAASASINGASAYILGLSKTREIQTYVSLDVLRETRKNIEDKLDLKSIRRFLHYSQYAHLNILPQPDYELTKKCGKFIHSKDVLILAAAISSPADYIITFDRKHFLKKEVIEFVRPKIIFIPGDFVRNFKSST